MALCYATTVPLLAVLDRFSCSMSMILLDFSFSLIIFASLLTKTNRIVRILAGSKKRIRTSKPVVVNCSDSHHPDGDWHRSDSHRWDVDSYTTATLWKLSLRAPGYWRSAKRPPETSWSHSVLTFFLSARAPFMRSKRVTYPRTLARPSLLRGFAMYRTCVIWVAFLPIYFSASESETITFCFFISLSAAVALILLLGPKLYIIIFKPEKNNQSAFTYCQSLHPNRQTSDRINNISIKYHECKLCYMFLHHI